MPILVKRPNKTPLGLYVHVPFCRSKLMKRILPFLPALLLLTACGSDAAPEPAAVPETTVSVQIMESTMPETTAPTEPEIPVVYLLETETSYNADGKIGHTYSYVYDDQGRELSYTNYTSGNDETRIYENHYDDQGRLINQTITNSDGTSQDTEPYTYYDEEGYREKSNDGLASLSGASSYVTREYLNEQGSIVKSETYVNGALSGTFEYDDQQNLLRRENSTMVDVYERDSQGNAVRMVSTNKMDGSENVTLYTNTYDEQNRILLTVTNEGGEDTQQTAYLYEDGRVTKTTTYLKDITYFFLYEEVLLHAAGDTMAYITDYDENGNKIRQETLENGQSDGYSEYTYKALELPAES